MLKKKLDSHCWVTIRTGMGLISVREDENDQLSNELSLTVVHLVVLFEE